MPDIVINATTAGEGSLIWTSYQIMEGVSREVPWLSR